MVGPFLKKDLLVIRADAVISPFRYLKHPSLGFNFCGFSVRETTIPGLIASCQEGLRRSRLEAAASRLLLFGQNSKTWTASTSQSTLVPILNVFLLRSFLELHLKKIGHLLSKRRS